MLKHRKLIALIALLTLGVFLLTSCAGQKPAVEEPAAVVETDADRYAKAAALLAEGKTAEARAAFEALGGYEDAASQVAYLDAAAAEEAGNFAAARDAFAALGDFRDSGRRAFDARMNALASDYAAAKLLLMDGRYGEAAEAFAALEGYEEASRYRMYARAMQLAGEGDYATAATAFTALGDFHDAALQASYYGAMALEAGEDFGGAETAYGAIPVFRDADHRLEALGDRKLDALFAAAAETYRAESWSEEMADTFEDLLALTYTDDENKMKQQAFDLADEALAAGRMENALPLFTMLAEGGMQEAAAKLQDCAFAQAMALMDAGDYAGATEILAGLTDYAPAEEPLKQCYGKLAEDAEAAGDFARACELYALAGIEEKVAAFGKAYADALTLLGEGQYDEAREAFLALKNYQDAARMAEEALYRKAQSLEAAGDYEGAIAQFAALGGYSDAAVQILGVSYRQGAALMGEEKWDEASAAFARAGSYADAAERVLEPYYRKGLKLLADGDEIGAFAAFSKAEGFGDSEEQIKSIYFAQAERYMATENWDAAIENYTKAGDYADAAEKIAQCEARRNGAPAEQEAAEAEAPAEETAEAAPAEETAEETPAEETEPNAEATPVTTTASDNK